MEQDTTNDDYEDNFEIPLLIEIAAKTTRNAIVSVNNRPQTTWERFCNYMCHWFNPKTWFGVNKTRNDTFLFLYDAELD